MMKRRRQRRFTVILLVTVLLLLNASSAFAIDISSESCGVLSWFKFRIKITPEQLEAVGGIIDKFRNNKPAGSPGAFVEPIEVPPGWTYETDGETYLLLIPPSPITEPTAFSYGFHSTKPPYQIPKLYSLQALDAGDNILEEKPLTCFPATGSDGYWQILTAIPLMLTGVYLLLRRQRVGKSPVCH